MKLKPHEERVVAEKAELDDRLAKLDAFGRTPLFASLPADEQGRLNRQHALMEQYSAVLGERIAAYTHSPVLVLQAVEACAPTAPPTTLPLGTINTKLITANTVALRLQVYRQGQELARVAPDGTVTIHWDAVEAAAKAEPWAHGDSARDIALLLLAARDAAK